MVSLISSPSVAPLRRGAMLGFIPLTLVLAAQADPGRTGANFLQIMLSPRAVAMGDAGVALGDDVLSAMDLNPASLGVLRYPEAAFSYNSWLNGVRLHHLAYAQPFGRWGTAAVSGTWLLLEPIAGYDNSGAPASSVNAGDLGAQGAYAARLLGGEDVRFGLFAGGGLRYVRETLETASASSMLVDAGLLERVPLGASALGLGASVESAGQGIRFDQESDPAPAVARLGASWTTPVINDPLSFVFEARKPAFDRVSLGGGVEYVTRRILAFRLGWSSDGDLGNGLRFGVGINLKLLRLDYGVGSFGAFGLTHRLALSTRFGEPMGASLPVSEAQEATARSHIERGNQLMDERRPYEAALEYNEALLVDPLNRDAIEKLRYARDMIESQKR